MKKISLILASSFIAIINNMIAINTEKILAQETSEIMLKNAYCQILKRPLDDNGRSTYIPKLQNNSLNAKELILSLIKSDEYKNKNYDPDNKKVTIQKLYQDLLGRKADIYGLKTYARELRDKGYESVVNDIINSSEYNKSWGNNKIPEGQSNNCR